jgi:hypothetical protein
LPAEPDDAEPFAGYVVEQLDRIAGLGAHHRDQIMRLRAVDPDLAGREFGLDEQARGGLRRPGGGCGHGLL